MSALIGTRTAPVVAEVVIRTAIGTDVPQLVAMAGRFLEMPEYRGRLAWTPDRLATVAQDLLGNPEAAIFLAEQADVPIGLLALHVFEHPMSGERIASEVIWFVAPEARGAGVRLLRAADAWAKAQHADVMQMIAPTAHVGAFYARIGYAPVETIYQRKVT